MAKKSVSTPNASKVLDQTDETISIEYEGHVLTESIPDTLSLCDLTPREINERLAILPGKFAYWKALSADIELQIERLSREYDLWYAKAYMLAKSANEKSTETLIKNSVLLENGTEYNRRMSQMENLRASTRKLEAIIKGLDMESRTLVAIASMTRAEMGSLVPKGSGSLGD